MMRAKEAWTKAAECAVRAEDAMDERARILFKRLHNSWIRVAERCEFLEDMEPDPPVHFGGDLGIS